MKSLVSSDVFEQDTRKVFVIRRADPKVKPASDEIPHRGELIMLDGQTQRVESADVSHDAPLSHWPCILVTVIG